MLHLNTPLTWTDSSLQYSSATICSPLRECKSNKFIKKHIEEYC